MHNTRDTVDMSMAITEAAPTPFEEITSGQRPPMSIRQLTDAIRCLPAVLSASSSVGLDISPRNAKYGVHAHV